MSTINFKAIGLLEGGIQTTPFTCWNQHGDQERMVMVRSITIPRILKRWSNPHDILDIKDGNTPR